MLSDYFQSAPAALVPVSPSAIDSQLSRLTETLIRARRTDLGYPGGSDLRHSGLSELMTQHLINNIGDPFEDGTVTHHTKGFERQVLDAFAWLFRAPPGQWWGYVATGSSEGTLHALRAARARYPDGIVLYTAAAHYSVKKAVDLLGLPSVEVAADEYGEMNYSDLGIKLQEQRDRIPILVATIGTTMTEAIDDIHAINAICDYLGIRERFLHADAALSGVPLALLSPGRRPGFDLADGADSIVCSGHKFLSTLMPCAVLIMKTRTWTDSPAQDRRLERVDYIGGHDTTIAGSRNGHLPVLLWTVLQRNGIEGLRERAETARKTAQYACQRLRDISWDAWRHPHAFTVVMRTPPAHITARWPLPSSNGWSHIITMPGITREMVDALIDTIATSQPDPHLDEPLIQHRSRPVVDIAPRW